MPEKKSLIIIEDHPVIRHGLAAWFAQTGRWNISGAASSLADAKNMLAKVAADIVLLDIQLEDGWGLDIIPWLANHSCGVNTAAPMTAQSVTTPLLTAPLLTAVYSAFDDYAHVSAAMSLGVKAYVTKRRSEAELEAALLQALSGAIYIDEAAQTKLWNVTNIFSLLTKREAEILTLVKSGLSNKQIAGRLGISRRTVENILSCVYDKTGIRSRLELERL